MFGWLKRPDGGWRLRRVCLAVALALGVLVVMAPVMAGFSPFRSWLFSSIFRKINGKVATGGASFTWWSRPIVYDLQILPPSGPALITIPRVETDRTLWALATNPADLGHVRADRLQARLVLGKDGSNFKTVFGREAPRPDEPRFKGLRGRSLAVTLTDAALTWESPKSSQPWTMEGVNLTARIRPQANGPDAPPELYVEHGKLVDHLQISPGMCDDVLKYAAPILAGVPRAEGEISVEMGDGRLPLQTPATGEISGKLSLHSVKVGPGPLVEQLARLLNLPATTELARDCVVSFEMIDGRVRHKDLVFRLGPFRVQTGGEVGLDQTLDLVAEVRLADRKIESDSQRPIWDALNRHVWRLPIRGTLHDPKPDWARIPLDLFALAVDELQSDHEGQPRNESAGQDAFDELTEGWDKDAQESEDSEQAPTTLKELITELPAAVAPVVEELWKRRRERRQRQAEAQEKAAAEGAESAPTTDPPAGEGRPLRKMLRKILRGEDKTAPAEDAPAPPDS